jgi:hypothetical protein
VGHALGGQEENNGRPLAREEEAGGSAHWGMWVWGYDAVAAKPLEEFYGLLSHYDARRGALSVSEEFPQLLESNG